MSVKTSLIAILETSKEAVSGQEIADKLGVSRNAVCKAINKLKEQGYDIQATTNKGYLLKKGNDILSKEGIGVFLDDKYKDIDIIIEDVTASTNADALKLVIDGAKAGTLVVADSQTQGRGRIGRSFFSPKSGIYMSIIIKPNCLMEQAVRITPAVAIAVCRAMESVKDCNPQIKWVNDIYINGKKICGILSQASSDFENGYIGSVVVGIGINFRTKKEDFPIELQEKAGALFEDTIVSRNELIAKVYNEFLPLVQDMTKVNFMNEYRQRSLVIGKEIAYQINNQDRKGVVVDIDDNGGLLVQEQDKQILLNCGEISIKSPTGKWL